MAYMYCIQRNEAKWNEMSLALIKLYFAKGDVIDQLEKVNDKIASVCTISYT